MNHSEKISKIIAEIKNTTMLVDSGNHRVPTVHEAIVTGDKVHLTKLDRMGNKTNTIRVFSINSFAGFLNNKTFTKTKNPVSAPMLKASEIKKK